MNTSNLVAIYDAVTVTAILKLDIACVLRSRCYIGMRMALPHEPGKKKSSSKEGKEVSEGAEGVFHCAWCI